MVTAERLLLYAQRWKNNETPSVEDWIIKLTSVGRNSKANQLGQEKVIKIGNLIRSFPKEGKTELAIWGVEKG